MRDFDLTPEQREKAEALARHRRKARLHEIVLLPPRTLIRTVQPILQPGFGWRR